MVKCQRRPPRAAELFGELLDTREKRKGVKSAGNRKRVPFRRGIGCGKLLTSRVGISDMEMAGWRDIDSPHRASRFSIGRVCTRGI
jgi:hypothetical protein